MIAAWTEGATYSVEKLTAEMHGGSEHEWLSIQAGEQKLTLSFQVENAGAIADALTPLVEGLRAMALQHAGRGPKASMPFVAAKEDVQG